MITSARDRFNRSFTQDKYARFIQDLDQTLGHKITFRVAESPVFVPRALKESLLAACEDIFEVLMRPDFKTLTQATLGKAWDVPNEDEHATCFHIDFAVTLDQSGNFFPQLIELQGFPSLFAYQHYLIGKYREHFDIAEGYSPYLSGLDEQSYLDRLGRFLLGGHSPAHVVLLEIEPHKQNTAIDFIATEHYFGIRPVCLSEIIKEGKLLYYMRDGEKTPIHRIYNRIIFDELFQRDDLPRQFNLTDTVDVEWVCHPNWYSRISKFVMPFFNSPYVPESRLLSDFDEFPNNLEDYVLKPLYSFSGSGVEFHVKPSHLLNIAGEDFDKWMLQRKVKYEPVVQAADEGLVKVEIRMIFFWEKGNLRPEPVVTIARLSRGELIGVKYNKNKTWVGGSVCFFEE